MNCAWNELLDILPPGLREQVDVIGRTRLLELRLRCGQGPVMDCSDGRRLLSGTVIADTVQYVVNMACRYSPWTAASATEGFLTAKGGHRIGICGETVLQDGKVTGFGAMQSLNIRVARDFPGLAQSLETLQGNVLILGPPGSGKTTLLRDLIRQRSRYENLAVVDSRGELFPLGFSRGWGVDVLTGCDKSTGMTMLLRTMGPDTLAVDEITHPDDCKGLLQAGWCGVGLLATAHAGSLQELYRRPIYAPLIRGKLFDYAVVMHRDRTFRVERMEA